MRSSNHRVATAVLALVACLAVACSSSKSGSSSANSGTSSKIDTNVGKPVAGGTLTIGLGAETDGWNPTASQWAGNSYQVAQAIYDPLVAYGDDNKAHPYLAESITPNADSTVWTIKLRPNIKFHDGTPLNADAVKLQLDMDKASFLVGQAFHDMQSVDKVDDLTLKVTMSQSWAAFPAAIAGQAGFIAAPAQLKAAGAAATDHPIGTGPYVFKEWVRDDHLTVTKSPNYWRQDTAFPDTFIFKVITDDQTRFQSLQAGQIDEMSTGTASLILQARRDSNIQRAEFDSDPTTMVMINTAVPPLDDVRVRQALAYATDEDQLRTIVGRGMGQLSSEPYLPNSPWYVPSGYPTKADPTKAKSLIDAYKKDKGVAGNVKFTLGCTPTPTNQQSMDLIKQQWAKVGVDVDLKYTEQATYINNALLGSYQANCWIQLGSLDPDGDSIWWTSKNANPPGALALNFMRLKDPQIDAALETGRRESDTAKRKDAYGTVWKRFAADFPYIYLGHPHIAILYSKRFHGVGSEALPDGTKQLLYRGAIPATIPLAGVWVK